MRARESLPKLEGIKVREDITLEMWEAEFTVMDKDKNGYISFGEFCHYVINKIVTPMDFIAEPTEDHEDDEEDVADVEENPTAAASTVDNSALPSASVPSSARNGPSNNVEGSIEHEVGVLKTLIHETHMHNIDVIKAVIKEQEDINQANAAVEHEAPAGASTGTSAASSHLPPAENSESPVTITVHSELAKV